MKFSRLYNDLLLIIQLELANVRCSVCVLLYFYFIVTIKINFLFEKMICYESIELDARFWIETQLIW